MRGKDQVLAALIWGLMLGGAVAQGAGAGAETPDATADLGAFLNQQQIKNLAVFESTLERWVLLERAQRTSIRKGYEQQLGVVGRKYVAHQSILEDSAEETQEAIGETVESLNETTKEYSAQVGTLEKKRQAAVKREYSTLPIGVNNWAYNYALKQKRYEEATGRYNPQTDQRLYQHGTRLNIELDAADARAEVVNKGYNAEIDATKNAYRAEKRAHTRAIANLETTARGIEGAMSINNQNRAKAYASVGSFLDRIYQMNDAMQHKYTPVLDVQEIDQYYGDRSEQFPPFAIGSPLWRIEWEVTQWSSPQDKLTIIVFDSEKDQPFTSVTSKEPYLESFRILDETGTFYLKASVRGNPQFRIRVTEYDLD